MYKDNIFYIIGILSVLSISIMFYSGVKEGYFGIFLLAFIIAPALMMIKQKTNLKADFTFTVITVLIIAIYAIIFWKYKDGRLLNFTDISKIPEEARSQFSFENNLKLGYVKEWC